MPFDASDGPANESSDRKNKLWAAVFSSATKTCPHKYNAHTGFPHRARQSTIHGTLISAVSSDICTCRPYLTHAIEECIRTAQQGGTGVCIYYRKEVGRV